MDFYRAELKKSPRAIEYLKGRGLTGEIAARYRIGYAPDDWQGLKEPFPEYEDKALVECGLVIDGDEGKRYDRFRDRVMFPILNARGAVIGFGGRILDKGEPKYLNSPETPLFEKGRELYGLPQARDAIRHAGPGAGGRGLHGRGGARAVRRRLRGGDARHRDHAGARVEAAAPRRRAGVLLRRRRRRAQGRLAGAGSEPAARAGPQADPLPLPARRRGPGHLRAQARQGRLRGPRARGARRSRSSCSPSCAPTPTSAAPRAARGWSSIAKPHIAEDHGAGAAAAARQRDRPARAGFRGRHRAACSSCRDAALQPAGPGAPQLRRAGLAGMDAAVHAFCRTCRWPSTSTRRCSTPDRPESRRCSRSATRAGSCEDEPSLGLLLDRLQGNPCLEMVLQRPEIWG